MRTRTGAPNAPVFRSTRLPLLTLLTCLSAAGCGVRLPELPVRSAAAVSAEPLYRPRPPATEGTTPLLPRLVPAPTGRNGYEDLLAAVDLLRREQPGALQLVVNPDRPLAQRERSALGHSAVRRALGPVRRGLGKPFHVPDHAAGRWASSPGSDALQRLANLLHTRMVVLLEAGGTREALACADDAVRLGRRVQAAALISAPPGLRIEVRALGLMGHHRHRVTGHDLERLATLARHWHAERKSPVGLLRLEQAHVSAALQGVCALDGLGFGRLLTTPDFDFVEDRAIIEHLSRLATGAPRQLAGVVAEARQRADRYFADAVREAARPAWERALVDLPRDRDPSVELLGRLLSPFEVICESSEKRDSLLRLPITDALVRRYRERRGRLPASLAALRLGTLAIDPFTGGGLRFEPRGNRFDLLSAGPSRDIDPASGVRPTISLDPTEYRK